MAAHRRSDRRRVYLCAGGLRKGVQDALIASGGYSVSIRAQTRFWRDPRRGVAGILQECHESVMKIQRNPLLTWCTVQESNLQPSDEDSTTRRRSGFFYPFTQAGNGGSVAATRIIKLYPLTKEVSRKKSQTVTCAQLISRVRSASRSSSSYLVVLRYRDKPISLGGGSGAMLSRRS